MDGTACVSVDDLDSWVVASVNGHAGEPLLIDPRRFHSVVTASVVRFCFFRDLQQIGGTECGICVERIRENFPKSFVLLVGRLGLDLSA
jgi:hypothetical protein